MQYVKSEVINRFAHTQDDKIMLAKIYDKYSEAVSRDIPITTAFHTKHEQVIAESMLQYLKCDMQFNWFGGYEAAERAILCFTPDYLENYFTSPLSVIRADYNDTLTHRDFLGSIMGLGLKRETIGDILVNDSSCYIIFLSEIEQYLLSNLISAGKTKLSLSTADFNDIVIPESKYKVIQSTVSSLRIDNIVSAGFTVSRSKACDFIESGRVNLNWAECLKTDKCLNSGDTVSLRGYGKILLNEIGSPSRKGRINVTIYKYI